MLGCWWGRSVHWTALLQPCPPVVWPPLPPSRHHTTHTVCACAWPSPFPPAFTQCVPPT
jgi:hypothetical protein